MVDRKGISQAKKEANARYDAKTYNKIMVALRIEDDADIIESIKCAQEQGMTKREWLRELFELANK